MHLCRLSSRIYRCVSCRLALHRIHSGTVVEFDLFDAIIPSAENENQTEDDERDNQIAPPNVESISSLTNVQLEQLAKEWMRSIQKILMAYTHKEPVDDSPISEYELWQMQELEFKNVLENMKHPIVVAAQSM